MIKKLLLPLCLLLSACGGGFSAVNPSETERIFVVEHEAGTQLAAFDTLDEWIGLSWNSAQDVVQTKNERTGTFVVKWVTPVPMFGTSVAARSTMLVKATDKDVTFTLMAGPGPGAYALTGVVLEGVYKEWNGMMRATPWGPARMTSAATPTRTQSCRRDDDCDRGQVCGDSGQCLERAP